MGPTTALSIVVPFSLSSPPISAPQTRLGTVWTGHRALLHLFCLLTDPGEELCEADWCSVLLVPRQPAYCVRAVTIGPFFDCVEA